MNENEPQALQKIIEESLIEIQAGQETLDSILDKYPDIAGDLRPGLEAAIWLSSQRPSLDPRPGFISASRARLVEEISKSKPGGVTSQRLPFLAPLTQIFQRKYAIQFALVFILLIGFLSTGTIFVAAANNSIPGDPLYNTKLNIEQARLAFTPTEIGRTRLNINFAERRSEELHQIVLQGRYEYIPQTVDRFDTHVEEAINSLESIADTHPEVALVMSETLQEVVDSQVVLLTVMAESATPQIKLNLQIAIQVTESRSMSINELLQKIINQPPDSTATLASQITNTPRPTSTATQLLPASETSTSTSTATATPSASPTPASTDVKILPLPTNTPTPEEETEPRDPTDTPVPPSDTDTPSPEPQNPTDTPVPTDTTGPPDPTDIPIPTQPTDPPDPTDIPGFGDGNLPTSTPKSTKTPKPTKTPRP